MAISTSTHQGIDFGFEQVWTLPKDKLSILDQHRMLVGVKDPYWEVMRRNPKEALFEAYERGPFLVRIGKLTSFLPSDMQHIVEGCYTSYLDQGTFGDFNRNNLNEEARLHAAMVSGFRPEQTFVSIIDEISGRVVGGTIVTPGLIHRRVIDAVGREDSAIPTFSSLRFDADKFGNYLEDESVGCSRFWRLPSAQITQLLERRDINELDYSKQLIIEVLSGMARASKAIMNHLGKTHRSSWFDTTDPAVLKTVSKHYGAQILPNDTTPTQSVSDSPLHWHFDMPSFIGVFDAETQYELAEKANERLGSKMTVFYSD